jgi:hypothetical protein
MFVPIYTDSIFPQSILSVKYLRIDTVVGKLPRLSDEGARARARCEQAYTLPVAELLVG